jgi:hypothetical protein
MPHITDEGKKVVHETLKPIKEGDLCFLFSEGALVEYNANPRWSTIHKIRKALRSPYHTEWTHLIIQKYMANWGKLDIETAADLAFFEFYRIVGARYEDGMIEQNGNAFKGALIPSLLRDTPVQIEDGKVPVLVYTEPDVTAKRKVGRPKKEVISGTNLS